MFTSQSIEVPAEVAIGASVKVNPRSPLFVGLSGTFNASVQFQWSPLKSGDVWYPLGSVMTAGGIRELPAGRARRVRASTTVFTSGAPVAVLRHDLSGDAMVLERDFVEETVEVPEEVDAGAAVKLEDGEQALFCLNGTVDGTYQLQISLSDDGDDWYNWGPALADAGHVVVPRGIARRVRVNTTAYNAEEPTGHLIRGFSAETVEQGEPETVTAGALSLLTRVSLLSIADAKAYSLGDGLYLGQIKEFIVVAVSGSPDGTLTPSTFADGTSIDVDALLESGTLVWTTAGWRLVRLQGATIGA